MGRLRILAFSCALMESLVLMAGPAAAQHIWLAGSNAAHMMDYSGQVETTVSGLPGAPFLNPIGPEISRDLVF